MLAFYNLNLILINKWNNSKFFYNKNLRVIFTATPKSRLNTNKRVNGIPNI